MASDSLPLEAPMLPPLVLRPPFGPRLLRGCVLALAVIFHVFTAGWSLIANGREGDIAGAARLLLREQGWRIVGTDSPAGPLSVWLAKGSMNLFGVNEFGARLPTALSVLAIIWFTMRIGERFGGVWRGFAAGMLLLCTPGMFSLARTLTPAPLETALLSAGFYFLVRGCERQTGRRQWFFFFWIAMALTYFAGGWSPIALVAGTIAILLLFYREARLRFRPLLSWEGGVVAGLAVASAAACGFWGVASSLPGLSSGKMALWQPLLLFPWSLLLIPAAWAVMVRLGNRHSLGWSEAFPLAWMASGLAVLFLFPGGDSLFDTIMVWPAFAIWAAYRLEITPRIRFLRAMSAVLAVSVVGLILCGRLREILAWMFPAIGDSLRGIPHFLWPSVAPVAFISILAFTLIAGAALVFEFQHHRRYALLALFGALIPAGYAFADASSKFAPYFSCADLAYTIDGSGDTDRGIALGTSRFAVSSLSFYLDSPRRMIELSPTALPPNGKVAFLVVPRSRFPDWKAFLGHEWRMVAETGGNLLLTDLPETQEIRRQKGEVPPAEQKTPLGVREGD